MKDAFSAYHPVVNMAYFAVMLGLGMFFLHPVCLAISFSCAFAYALYLNGRKALRFNLLFLLPMLLLTLVLNPLFNHEGATILAYFRNGNLLQRASLGLGFLSVMVTWALENAIDTANTMTARGYGLPGRTAFSLYRISRRDKLALIFIVFCAMYIIIGALQDQLHFHYYPTMRGPIRNWYTLSLFAVYLALGLLPLAINIKEACKWKAILSKI